MLTFARTQEEARTRDFNRDYAVDNHSPIREKLAYTASRAFSVSSPSMGNANAGKPVRATVHMFEQGHGYIRATPVPSTRSFGPPKILNDRHIFTVDLFERVCRRIAGRSTSHWSDAVRN